VDFSLLSESLLQGALLGCFYAAVSLGLAVAFGLLDVPHIAHPGFLVVAAYGTYALGQHGVDPILAGFLLMPVFYFLGIAVYQFYYATFERRGTDQGLRGLAFFFGLAFIIEVLLIMQFGIDQRMVEAPYIGQSLELGDMRIPYRLVAAFLVAVFLMVTLNTFLSRTFTGRAIKAVAQDEGALRLMGADPVKVKRIAFGIATAAAALAGALLIVVAPVDPQLGRVYIGRTFCVVVLAGMGSISGTVIAGVILGIAETIVLTSAGASWAPAVSFGILLVVLAVRPAGLFGR
jgi:branched-chain amino acid transport system permease protein